MYQLEGIIKYHQNWVVAEIDKDLGPYYRALLPKSWYVQSPMCKPHVSIVRVFEKPKHDTWGKYENKTIILDIFDGVQTDGIYFWLDCLSDEIGFIRRSMGLKTFRQNKYSNYNCYHITIGNTK